MSDTTHECYGVTAGGSTSEVHEWATTEDLCAALATECGTLSAEVSPRITKRHASAYSTSFFIEELEVDCGGSGSRRVVFKDLGPGALIEGVKKHRPKFLYSPSREILVYRHLLSRGPPGTATLFGSVLDRALKRYWLLIEHINGPQLRHVGELSAWEEAARWLAFLHATFASDAHEITLDIPLLMYDGDFFRQWWERAIANIERRQSSSQKNISGDLRAGFEQAIALLGACRSTLVHGEFYPSNVLLRATEGPPWGVCPVDWEVAGWGPGVLDLAALTAGNWSFAQRDAMLGAYSAEFSRIGGDPPALSDLRRMVDAARIVSAVQWLGWGQDWTAPADQARDWLKDAMDAGKRLLVC